MKSKLFAVGLGSFICSAFAAQEFCSPPFVGTQGMGNLSPAACAPFGIVLSGPDTSESETKFTVGKAHCGGYQHNEPYVWRFSQTHVSGTGCPSGGNFGILPVTDAAGLPDRGALMLKDTETASPGRYGVTLNDGIRCDITAGRSKAAYSFAYPKGKRQLLLVDLDWAMGDRVSFREDGATEVWGRTIKGCACYFDSPRQLHGFQRLFQWVEYSFAFAAKTSKDIVGKKLLREADGLHGETWLLDFGVSDGTSLDFTIAISMKDSADASSRLAEPTDGTARWQDWFARCQIDPTTDARTRANFAAAMYHLAIHPCRIAGDGDTTHFVNFSLWDTFRAAHPLYTLIAPDAVNGFVNSLLIEYRSRGFLPIISYFGRETHCMVGHHAVAVIADAYLKGYRGFDVKAAGDAIWNSLTIDHVPESISTWGFMKEDWYLYNTFGYYPYDILRTNFRGGVLKGESVSRTIECAYDDACAAKFFAAIGDREKAQFFTKRSANWRNVFDPAVGFVRGKDSKGRWREPFDPAAIGHGPWADNDFTEGNSYQYTWHVMQDPEGLVAAMGGPTKAGEKLDQLFTTKASEKSYDVSGLIGQYAHGNEVSHHIAYFYAFTDRPWRTADIIRQVFATQYEPRPDGLSGNDDCGQMSAWYIFSMLGFYPFDPCGGDYVIGAPQVKSARLRLKNGTILRIRAEGLSDANRYVRKVTLNGKPITGHILKHAELELGGDLVFEMYSRQK